MLKKFILLFAFALNQLCYSQNLQYEFERFSIDEGLSQSTIYCITQDYLGYMWFGTEDGLNRFDGFNFTIFTRSSPNESSLSSNRIMSILEDSKYNLWVGTIGGGLNLYNRYTDGFSAFRHEQGNDNSLADDKVMSLCEDSKGNIWVGTSEGGISVLNPTTKTFKNYQHRPHDPSSLPGNLVRTIVKTPDGTLYVGTSSGLCLYQPYSDSFTHIEELLKISNSVLTSTVLKAKVDSNGDIWFTIENYGAAHYSPSKNSYEIFTSKPGVENSLVSSIVIDIFPENDTTIWFATYNGLQIYNPKTNIFTTFKNDPSDPYSISDNLIRCVYQDKSGVIWIGTYSNGVNKLNNKYIKFPVYRNQFVRNNRLPNSAVRALEEDENGDLWVGTFGKGIVKLKTGNGTIEQHPIPKLLKKENDYLYITSLKNDGRGNLWIGTSGNGLLKYNLKRNELASYKNLSHNENSLGDDRIRCLLVDIDQNLWIGTSGGGLYLYNHQKNSFTSFRHNSQQPNSSLTDDRVLCIFEDDMLNLWVGTSNGGLNLLDRKTNTFKHFFSNPNSPETISSNRIFCLFQDSKKRLWVGTNGGLNLFNYSTETFKSFKKSDGLPNEVIYGILEDGLGSLWLSTNSGLCKFDYSQSEGINVTTYKKNDGLQSNEFNEGAYLKLKSGQLVFGGIYGLNIFNPQVIPVNNTPPFVNISKITHYSTKGKKRITNQVITYGISSVNLPHYQNNISFEFNTLHYINPQSNTILYKLEGFESEWIKSTPGQRNAAYTNLSPGTYTFKVIAANRDGVWNNEGASLSVKIARPFWLTWWFILLALISFGLIVFALIRLRVRNLLKAKRQLEESVKLRTAEIQHQNEEIKIQADNLYQINEELKTQHEELERTQGILIQSEKMASLGVLTAGIAHEINNPINFVYAGVNSLSKDFDDISLVLENLKSIKTSDKPSEIISNLLTLLKQQQFEEAYEGIRQTISDIKTGAERTAEIVEGLRNFSRTEQYLWSSANIHGIIDGVLMLLKNKYKNRIEIIRNFDPTIDAIDCRPGKINQAILNIISNGIDAIADKGEITITTKNLGSNISISIKDNGMGIRDEVKAKIFDPFYTTKDVGKGIGLGLSITYGIINEHKGTIKVESSVGEGTNFEITLPVKHPATNSDTVP